MPFFAALQFSGKNSIIWSSLSTHSFVRVERKAHYRVASCTSLVPCSGVFAMALNVSHNEDSHLFTFDNEGSMPGLQETIVYGSLSTCTKVHTALLMQEGTAFKVAEDLPSGEPCSVHNRGVVKNNAEIHRSYVSLKKPESATNKGRAPGKVRRRLSEETKELIRARTREAMKDPKIRERLRKKKEGSTQSLQTKLKIKASVANFWDLKKKAQKRQESCLKEWEELIADAARRGSDGDVLYQWDSYKSIWVELRDAWKKLRRARTGERTDDHRNKISKAIRAKWADPNYRKRVRNGILAHLSNRGAQLERLRKPARRRASKKLSNGASLDNIDAEMVGTQKKRTKEEMPPQKKRTKEVMPPQKKRTKEVMPPNPILTTTKLYKDPLTQHRLEKLKRMRAGRLFLEERRRKDITQRARVLMAEARRAAAALEAAAIKDKNALGPLLETRRLLAEAARSFEIAGLGIDGLSPTVLEVEVAEETNT